MATKILLKIFAFFLFGLGIIYSQSLDENVKVSRDGFYPVPVLFYLPNTGYAFGAVFLYYNNPDPGNPNRFPDIIGGFGTYSTKKQVQGSIRVNRYFGDNDKEFLIKVLNYGEMTKVFVFSTKNEVVKDFDIIIEPNNLKFHFEDNSEPLKIDYSIEADKIEIRFK